MTRSTWATANADAAVARTPSCASDWGWRSRNWLAKAGQARSSSRARKSTQTRHGVRPGITSGPTRAAAPDTATGKCGTPSDIRSSASSGSVQGKSASAAEQITATAGRLGCFAVECGCAPWRLIASLTCSIQLISGSTGPTGVRSLLVGTRSGPLMVTTPIPAAARPTAT